MSKEYVAKTLKRKRQEAGYSVKDISEKFNKSIKTVYSWENGQGQPDADTLISLCYLYGIQSFDELDETKEGMCHNPEEFTKLFHLYHRLNSLGKKEAAKRIEELTMIEKYTKQDTTHPAKPYHFSARLTARNGKNTLVSGDTEMTPEEVSQLLEKAADDSKDFKI